MVMRAKQSTDCLSHTIIPSQCFGSWNQINMEMALVFSILELGQWTKVVGYDFY